MQEIDQNENVSTGKLLVAVVLFILFVGTVLFSLYKIGQEVELIDKSEKRMTPAPVVPITPGDEKGA